MSITTICFFSILILSPFRLVNGDIFLVFALLANGVNLKTVQNILGHYNILVTSKYIHTNEEIDKEGLYKIFNKIS